MRSGSAASAVGGVGADAGAAELVGEVAKGLFAAGEERDGEALAAEAASDGRAESGTGAQDEHALRVNRGGGDHGCGSPLGGRAPCGAMRVSGVRAGGGQASATALVLGVV